MSLGSRLAVRRIWCAGPVAVLLIAGCGPQSAEQAFQKTLAKSGMQLQSVYPFAGKVTIDHAPPKLENRNDQIVVMLNDPAKPDVPLIKRLYVTTDPDGSFQFSSVRPGDGIPPGKYVVTFALLKTQGEMGLVGPDRFNNLYNDPDKNGKIEEFTIDHKALEKATTCSICGLPGRKRPLRARTL